MSDKIFPIQVTVYKDHKTYCTGPVYSYEELEEIVSYCMDKDIRYTVAYRETEEEIQS